MTADLVVLDVSVMEAEHLSALIGQFLELLDASSPSDVADPAIGRLLPAAYTADPDASDEFRRLTGSDLLERRRQDARVMLESLADSGGGSGTDDDPTRTFIVTLDADDARAWMRLLAAVRLVLASRLGIESENHHDDEDPRFGIYEWLGVWLEGLVRAVDAAD